MQEAHVKSCLDGGVTGPASAQQAGKYLVYKLPAESTLIGIECEFPILPIPEWHAHGNLGLGAICLEEFVKGA
jgi:hypothetical protein